MRKLIKGLSVCLLSSMLFLGGVSNVDAATKKVSFYAKNGTVLTVPENKLGSGCYSNAVFKANSEGLPYIAYQSVNDKAIIYKKWVFPKGTFMILQEDWKFLCDSNGNSKSYVKMAKIQPVDYLGKLNGNNVYGIDKSSSTLYGNTGRDMWVPREFLYNVAGNEYLIGQSDIVGRTWTTNKELRNFFYKHNVTKIKVK